MLWAAVTLAAASAGIAILPFGRAIRWGAVPLGQPGKLTIEDSVWAVEAASRRMPWPTVCIQKGLAVQRMLRSSGIDALLHYGARRAESTGELEAHVWVSVSGNIVIGAEEAVGFGQVAVFP